LLSSLELAPFTYLDLRNLNPNPELWPVELKSGTTVIPALGNVIAKFGFSMPFAFELVRSPYETQTDRHTHRQMVVQDPQCDLLGRPHNKS